MGKRKPMTDEQKQAAGDRLAKARALKNPPQYKNIHPSVLALDDDHKLSMKTIKGWMKTQRELLKTERYNHRKGDKKALAKIGGIQGYIRELEYYLTNGDYVALNWGEYDQNPVQHICKAMAYDKDGFPKRNIGVFYQDIGALWSKEMDDRNR